jgi:hypothetical protein
VNTWIELPSDHFTRVEEAVLRAVVSSVVNSSVPSTADRILNPNEMDLTEIGDKESEETLHGAANKYFEHLERESKSKSSPAEEGDNEPSVKKPKLDPNNLCFEQLVAYSEVELEKPELCELEFAEQEQEVQSQPSTSSGNLNENLEPDVLNDDESNDLSNSSSSPPPSDNDNQNHRLIPSHRSPTFVEHVLNAVGHPTVLKQVALQFLNNVKRDNPSN